MATEVKASEPHDGRLRVGEIVQDIEKLAAHSQETKARDSSFLPVAMDKDSATDAAERMTPDSLRDLQAAARELVVGSCTFLQQLQQAQWFQMTKPKIPIDADTLHQEAASRHVLCVGHFQR
jgi:hypothetical protein